MKIERSACRHIAACCAIVCVRCHWGSDLVSIVSVWPSAMRKFVYFVLLCRAWMRDVLGPQYHLYRRWGRSGMAELLDTLMRTPALRQELAEMGRAYVRASFSHARQAEALHAAYARMGV